MTSGDKPRHTHTTAVNNLQECIDIISAGGDNPFKCDAIADIDGTTLQWNHEHSPCLTRGRPYGHWVLCRGRRQSIDERLRLMGIPNDLVTYKGIPGVSERQMGQMIGNGMSTNVLERILTRLVDAAGLPTGPTSMNRNWESLSAARASVHAMKT